MRRKNSETFRQHQHQHQQQQADDSYHAKEKKKNYQCVEEKKSDSSPLTSVPTASSASSSSSLNRSKEPVISFYDRQHIKKLEYPQDRIVHSKGQKYNRRRLCCLDILCLCGSMVVCIGFIGATKRWQQQVQTATFQILLPYHIIFPSTKRSVQMPPSSNLLSSRLLETIQRPPLEQDNSYMPLLFTENYKVREKHYQMQKQGEGDLSGDTVDETNHTVTTTTPDLYHDRLHHPMLYNFEYPESIRGTKEYHKEAFQADYGNLTLRFLTDEQPVRTIYREAWERDGQARDLNQPRDDDVAQYWAQDDDWLRNPYVTWDDDTIQDVHKCRRTSWTRWHFPVANILHEIDFVENVPELIGEGAYREVFLFEQQVLNKTELFVLKQIHYELDFEYDMFEYVRVDSLVTERLSSNDRIVDMFGYTGVALIAEAFLNGDIEHDVVGQHERSAAFDPMAEPEVQPRNNFTGSEKLKLALDMVKPVAALHNFPDGIIVHDDIQLSQFLWTDETKSAVKLNDFNRAEVMFWDEVREEYCMYRNGRAHGDWRSPEEYRDDPINEKIDIWSLGNNFYSLLTGYYPFYDEEDPNRIKRVIARGEISKLDPRYHNRSFAESVLIEIIEHCWEFEVENRVDINDLQAMLEMAIEEDERRKQSGEPWVYVLSDNSSSGDDEESESESWSGSDIESSMLDVDGAQDKESDSHKEQRQPITENNPSENKRWENSFFGVFRRKKDAETDMEEADKHFDEGMMEETYQEETEHSDYHEDNSVEDDHLEYNDDETLEEEQPDYHEYEDVGEHSNYHQNEVVEDLYSQEYNHIHQKHDGE